MRSRRRSGQTGAGDSVSSYWIMAMSGLFGGCSNGPDGSEFTLGHGILIQSLRRHRRRSTYATGWLATGRIPVDLWYSLWLEPSEHGFSYAGGVDLGR